MNGGAPRLLDRFRGRVRGLMNVNSALLWAAAIGLLGALATVGFREALAAAQSLLFGRAGSFTDIAASLPWPTRLLVPGLGGLLAGALLALARRTAPDERPDYMDTVASGDGRVPVKVSLLHGLSSLLSIASGGSIGREGSMIQLAALSASVAGQAARLTGMRLRLLVACGAAAGITAAYNAPIASAFFISEILLGAIAMDSLAPIMVSSVIANITMRHLLGYHATYQMPQFPPVTSVEVLAFVVLGALSGLLAPGFLKALQQARHLFQASALPLPLRLGLGGLGVGVISVFVPQVWGNGYSVVNSLLHHQWLWPAVLAVLVCKVAATLLTCGSGAVGGIFTPTLFVGAAAGYLFALGVHAVWPAAGLLPAGYVAVGMGATLAAATSAPLMAMLMIFEMTLSYELMLPLMLACVLAYVVARAVNGPSMYEITAHRLAEAGAQARLRQLTMAELVRPAQTVVAASAPLAEAAALLRQHRVKYVYVVDAQQRYLGVVSVHDLAARPDAAAAPCAELARPDALPLVTPAMPLDEALLRFLEHHGERLPVVRDLDRRELLGAAYKTDVMDAYVRLSRATAGSAVRMEFGNG